MNDRLESRTRFLLMIFGGALVLGAILVFSLSPNSGPTSDARNDGQQEQFDPRGDERSEGSTQVTRGGAGAQSEIVNTSYRPASAATSRATGSTRTTNGRIGGLDLPRGYTRVRDGGEMTDYCRSLKLRPPGTPVRLFNGKLKDKQDAHVAVLDIEVGKRDLQQCADAVMRLRGEYLWGERRYDEIKFNFTSGDACVWNKWKEGWRPAIEGNTVTWNQTRPADDSYNNFMNYMERVFIYAGSASLSREMGKVPFKNMRIGDVLIKGGYPGHAVMVLDMAENARRETIFLLAQSYTPAQDIHVLKNPKDTSLSPWYELSDAVEVVTPEWTFKTTDLKRFR